jgi:HPt (histidine-containing phosphotransfer) domain-containing protein
MNSENKKLYSLDYLIETIGNDPEAIKMMVDVFLEYTPKDLAELSSAVKENDLRKVAFHAHKMKSSVAALRVDDLKNVLQSIDKPEKAAELKDDLPAIAQKINDVLTVVFEQLNRDFSS